MKAIILLLVLIFGIGISFGQTEEESDKLTVTIIDENGNVVELLSVPHEAPIVTEDSPLPPNYVSPPTDLTINEENHE